MTPVEILNFPTTFAVFRRHHSNLAFQIIRAIPTYHSSDTYTLENDNVDNNSLWNRFQSCSIVQLPFTNNSIFYIPRSNSYQHRVLWRSSGLFIKVPSQDYYAPSYTIPILTLSDYACLPPISNYSVCFVEQFFTHSILQLVRDTEAPSEMAQWLAIEQILLTWFSYEHYDENTEDEYLVRRRHRNRANTRILMHEGGPDDHDDRLTIPRDQLVGALARPRNRVRLQFEPRDTDGMRRVRAYEGNPGSGDGSSSESSSAAASSTPSTQIRLQKFTIDAIIEHAIRNEKTCSISMERINQENAGVLTCQHVFAKDSIQRWLESNTTCPECRCENVALC